jgi:hypothetical protein
LPADIAGLIAVDAEQRTCAPDVVVLTRFLLCYNVFVRFDKECGRVMGRNDGTG